MDEASKTSVLTAANNPPMANDSKPKRGFAFWMVILASLMVDLLSALDLTAIATALPTIVHRLNGTDFIWAGSAFTVASTAVLPLIGGFASVFGRKPLLLFFITTFAVGSAVTGAAQNMNMLIAGRAIQGLGAGGCLSVNEILFADLVPLPERGKFQGIAASVWALACAIGPPIGGALASSNAWRWLFFLNLPLSGIALVLVFVFLRVSAPKTSFKEKMARIDFLGNAVIIGSTIAILIALSWGGAAFSWNSAHVLVPLVLGAMGTITFGVIEAFYVKHPTMPSFCYSDLTVLSGYLGTFFHGIVSQAAFFYLPVYLQASKSASAIGSGVDVLSISCAVVGFAILTGLSIEVLGLYRPQNYVGWVFTVVGFGVLSILRDDSSRAAYIALQIPLGIGLGILWISTQFPILAPLPYSNNAHALGFFTFVRCFAQSWGTVIGGAILQGTLLRRLPKSFIDSLPEGVQIAYAVIPTITAIQQPLQAAVRAAFAESVKLIWQVMIAISGVGLLSCLLMKEIVLRTDMDETWELNDPEREKSDSPGSNVVVNTV